MATPPEVRYAKSGDVSIAYVDTGSGEPVVFVPGFISHVELSWEAPFLGPSLTRLADGARLYPLSLLVGAPPARTGRVAAGGLHLP